MKQFVFIAGAPGSGKSTIAAALQKRLNSPLFEFGWIPEFQNRGDTLMTYVEEEALAFENLTLVAKNYAKHGFKNVIITDLNNKYIEQLDEIFGDYDYSLFTLRLQNDEVLKARVLDESRSSGYRNWEEALAINESLLNREAFANEVFIDAENQSVDKVVDKITSHLGESR